jgi:energy-coupling factor transporter ATP-binding protein EcfA2
MKYFFAIVTFSLFLFFLVVTAPVRAETNVKVNNSTGGNTVCVNGKCTTTEGTSKSKVCVNGQCWDSTDENVDYKSPDGNTKVKITNNTTATTVAQSSDSKSTTTVNATSDVMNIEPTIKQEVKAAKDKVQAKKEEVKKKIEETKQKFDIMTFINAQLEELKSLFTFESLFGKK